LTNHPTRRVERGVLIQAGAEPGAFPFGAVEPGATVTTPLGPAPRAGVDGLALLSDPLGDALLRPWVESVLGPAYGGAPGGAPQQRYLICVLKDEGAPVSLDAALSGRSRSLTLLHVAEGP